MNMQTQSQFELLHAEDSATPIKGWVHGVPLEPQAQRPTTIVLPSLADLKRGTPNGVALLAPKPILSKSGKPKPPGSTPAKPKPVVPKPVVPKSAPAATGTDGAPLPAPAAI